MFIDNTDLCKVSDIVQLISFADDTNICYCADDP